jgi:ABC-type molybdenum transport system ATPase subunit/photorepair protein PhrA
MTVLSAEIELYQRSGIRILSGIRWDVEQGQHWILLGPNGSGKSSLVKLLTLYEWPTTGTIRIEDQVVGEFTMVELRKRIGLFEPNLQSEIGHHYPWVTAEEIVLTGKSGGLMLFGAPSEADLARARSMLAQESFDPGRTFCVMSSGEQRRTLLLRCLFSRPAVVILDEPYESLDIKARWEPGEQSNPVHGTAGNDQHHCDAQAGRNTAADNACVFAAAGNGDGFGSHRNRSDIGECVCSIRGAHRIVTDQRTILLRARVMNDAAFQEQLRLVGLHDASASRGASAAVKRLHSKYDPWKEARAQLPQDVDPEPHCPRFRRGTGLCHQADARQGNFSRLGRDRSEPPGRRTEADRFFA